MSILVTDPGVWPDKDGNCAAAAGCLTSVEAVQSLSPTQTFGGTGILPSTLFLFFGVQPEALLYQGLVLFVQLRDFPGATEALEHYLKVAPPGSDTRRVRQMIEMARTPPPAP